MVQLPVSFWYGSYIIKILQNQCFRLTKEELKRETFYFGEKLGMLSFLVRETVVITRPFDIHHPVDLWPSALFFLVCFRFQMNVNSIINYITRVTGVCECATMIFTVFNIHSHLILKWFTILILIYLFFFCCFQNTAYFNHAIQKDVFVHWRHCTFSPPISHGVNTRGTACLKRNFIQSNLLIVGKLEYRLLRRNELIVYTVSSQSAILTRELDLFIVPKLSSQINRLLVRFSECFIVTPRLLINNSRLSRCHWRIAETW